jgi:hypothetical protein
MMCCWATTRLLLALRLWARYMINVYVYGACEELYAAVVLVAQGGKPPRSDEQHVFERLEPAAYKRDAFFDTFSRN